METHLIWALSWGSDSLKGPSEGVSCFPWSAFPGDSVYLPEKTGERRGPPSARPARWGGRRGWARGAWVLPVVWPAAPCAACLPFVEGLQVECWRGLCEPVVTGRPHGEGVAPRRAPVASGPRLAAYAVGVGSVLPFAQGPRGGSNPLRIPEEKAASFLKQLPGAPLGSVC